MSNILIFSDDKSIVEQVSKAFSAASYQLTSLARYADALDHFATTVVDLMVITDCSTAIASEDFETVITRCRSQDIPVLLLAEEGTARRHLENLDLSVGDYLSIPIIESHIAQRTELLLNVKKRLDQLRAQAVVDELTGSYNRRYLDEQLSVRFAEARRYRTPFSFILFDLDHFKNVNDTYGHPFGDAILRETTELVRLQMRNEDILARYGGEEFAMILPHTDRQGAIIFAERVRELTAEHSYSNGQHTARVTISLGLASFPFDNVESVEKLIECADSRLYDAKESGRNRSVCE